MTSTTGDDLDARWWLETMSMTDANRVDDRCKKTTANSDDRCQETLATVDDRCKKNSWFFSFFWGRVSSWFNSFLFWVVPQMSACFWNGLKKKNCTNSTFWRGSDRCCVCLFFSKITKNPNILNHMIQYVRVFCNFGEKQTNTTSVTPTPKRRISAVLFF